jgi:hypothetical protein
MMTKTPYFRAEYRMTDHKLSENCDMRFEVLSTVRFNVIYSGMWRRVVS